MTARQNETPEEREARLAKKRAANQRYRQSPEGKARIAAGVAKYARTDKGRNADARRKATYRASEKGQAQRKAENARRPQSEHERKAQERSASEQATREQVRREREARQMARRKIVKPPRREPYKGTPGQKTGGMVYGNIKRGGLIPGVGRAEWFDWPDTEEGAQRAQNYFADWWSSIWQDVPVNKIVWGRKQIEAEEDYAKRLLAFRQSKRAQKHAAQRRRAQAPSKRRDIPR